MLSSSGNSWVSCRKARAYFWLVIALTVNLIGFPENRWAEMSITRSLGQTFPPPVSPGAYFPSTFLPPYHLPVYACCAGSLSCSKSLKLRARFFGGTVLECEYLECFLARFFITCFHSELVRMVVYAYQCMVIFGRE